MPSRNGQGPRPQDPVIIFTPPLPSSSPVAIVEIPIDVISGTDAHFDAPLKRKRRHSPLVANIESVWFGATGSFSMLGSFAEAVTIPARDRRAHAAQARSAAGHPYGAVNLKRDLGRKRIRTCEYSTGFTTKWNLRTRSSISYPGRINDHAICSTRDARPDFGAHLAVCEYTSVRCVVCC